MRELVDGAQCTFHPASFHHTHVHTYIHAILVVFFALVCLFSYYHYYYYYSISSTFSYFYFPHLFFSLNSLISIYSCAGVQESAKRLDQFSSVIESVVSERERVWVYMYMCVFVCVTEEGKE